MSFHGSNRRGVPENNSSATSTSASNQIIATLRSTLPIGVNSISSSQASQLLSSSRANRLSEYANMLSIPNFSTNSFSNNRMGHAHNMVIGNSSNASVHPSFRSKSVCSLECKFCGQDICARGMKAILLSDTRVELYSTDIVPTGRVQLVGEDYMTNNCHCRIRDVACLGCGNVCGYHVTQPCDNCMSACNNGHFWMFHDDAVQASERMDAAGKRPLLWAQISHADKEIEKYEKKDKLKQISF